MACWVHLQKNEGGEEGERDRREGVCNGWCVPKSRMKEVIETRLTRGIESDGREDPLLIASILTCSCYVGAVLCVASDHQY